MAVIHLSQTKTIDYSGYIDMEKANALSALAALGQETRLDVFRLLVQAGGKGLPAGEIAIRLTAIQNTMSAHLKVLTASGLIRPERSGRIIRYAVDMPAFRDLLAYLMEDCCNGRPELCRPAINAVTSNC